LNKAIRFAPKSFQRRFLEFIDIFWGIAEKRRHVSVHAEANFLCVSFFFFERKPQYLESAKLKQRKT